MGEIVWLGRYPVKSMLGDELTEASLLDSGIAGDRRFALLDEETGLVASAKNPGRWASLLGLRARYGWAGGALGITLPDGTTVTDGDPDVDAVLSSAVGRPVRLIRTRPERAMIERLTPAVEDAAGTMTLGALAAATPGDTFVDFAPVHVVTTATLDALGRGHPRGPVDPRRFRPNIVIRMVDGKAFAENDWPGATLSVGAAAVRVLVPTPRCAVPTLAQGTHLDEDPEVLRTAARLNRVPVLELGRRTCVGAYATVARAGRVRIGDVVRVAPALS